MSERRGTTSKFQHADALGSTRGITDSSQATTDSLLYDAFGMTVSRTGTTSSPFGFVGGSQYQTDSDSGLMLLGHRYYDASIGRFISQDPIQDGDNWYAYCENNPLMRIDASGLTNTSGIHIPTFWETLFGEQGNRNFVHNIDQISKIPDAIIQGIIDNLPGPEGPGNNGGESGGNQQEGGRPGGNPKPDPNAGKTVEEILKGKRGGIKQAPLPKGSPSWEDIRNMTWEQLEKGAKDRKTGLKIFHKLLTD